MALDGNSTAVSKTSAENKLSYNFGLMGYLGKFVATAAAAGDLTLEDPSPLEDTGNALKVRARVPIQSSDGIACVLTGTDTSDVAMTGSATIEAYARAGRAFDVTASDDWKTFTSMTITGAVAGDSIDIGFLPDADNNVLLGLEQGFDVDDGLGIKGIRDKTDYSVIDHQKKQYGDATIAIAALYQNGETGLNAIADREVTLFQEVVDDTGETVTETTVIEGARLGVTDASPADGNENVTQQGNGTFKRRWIFS